MYTHKNKLEYCNFRFKKKRDCTILEAKTEVLIICAVTVTFTAQLICAFVSAYAKIDFSHGAAHFIQTLCLYNLH